MQHRQQTQCLAVDRVADVDKHDRPKPSLLDRDLMRAEAAAASVVDPEIPVLTIEDLGVLRGVERREGRIVVKLTPTYSGCPAQRAIKIAVEQALVHAGVNNALVETVLSPPWTTDDMSDAGRRKLAQYGIAPPNRGAAKNRLFGTDEVACPRCGSRRTSRISEFGSTPCKAFWRCDTCLEPFDYFKCL
jgi:ring-1,2-phenylacetyl-CoA epoxidase subunit PaaD